MVCLPQYPTVDSFHPIPLRSDVDFTLSHFSISELYSCFRKPCPTILFYFSTLRATRWPVRAFGRSCWLIRGFQIWTHWLYLARWALSRVLSELKNAPSYSFIHLISNYRNLSLKRSFRRLGEAILVGLCSLAVALSKKLARAQEAF